MVFKWKKNHNCNQPKLLCFVDTESYEAPHPTDPGITQLRFRLGCARFGRWDGSEFTAVQSLRFNRVADFWRVLGENSSGKCVQWVFAHNVMFDAWQLDLGGLIDRGEFKLSNQASRRFNGSRKAQKGRYVFRGQFSIDRGCCIIKGVLAKKRINFVDSFNYFHCSLADLGDSLSIPKLQMPVCHADEDEWFTYCYEDVHILETAICGLMREWKANDLGNWQPTIASLAYSAYRHRFMTRPIVCHGDEDVSKIEHDAYYDGRTSVFFSGDIGNGYSLFEGGGNESRSSLRKRIDGPCYSVDINSLYPSVMLGNDYPVEAVHNGDGRPIIWTNPSLEWLRERLENHLCVAICKIATFQDIYPVRTTNGTIYPNGKIWTTLCTPEVTLALDRGHIECVMAVVLYKPWRIFDQWVSYWWERKRLAEIDGNLVRREICKTFLNSLAGKLAQRERYWINTQRWPCQEKWGSWPVIDTQPPLVKCCRGIGPQTQVLHTDGYAPHALVAVSAHVNSYARVRMINDRQALDKRDVLYMANDSFILTNSGLDRLRAIRGVDTGELGDYRITGCYESASIYGPRDYCVDGVTRKSGLPKDRRRVKLVTQTDGTHIEVECSDTDVNALNRRWKVKRFESHNSMIARPPDGSIHLHEEMVSGSEHHWGMYDPGDGWLRPNLVDMWGK